MKEILERLNKIEQTLLDIQQEVDLAGEGPTVINGDLFLIKMKHGLVLIQADSPMEALKQLQKDWGEDILCTFFSCTPIGNVHLK